MKTTHIKTCLVSLVLAFSVLGCSKKTTVPEDAKLIWQGVVDSPDEWKNVYPEDRGVLYLVEAKSGEVKEVKAIWTEKPNFTFTIERNEEYKLYFQSETSEKEAQNKTE